MAREDAIELARAILGGFIVAAGFVLAAMIPG